MNLFPLLKWWVPFEGFYEYSSGAINVINSFKDTFRYIGAEITGIVHESAMEAGEIKHNQNILIKAYELGLKLSSGN